MALYSDILADLEANLLTTREAGDELGLASNTIVQQIKNSKIKAYMFKGQYLIERSEIERYRQESKRK